MTAPLVALPVARDHAAIGLTVCPVHAWCMGHEPNETVTAASLHFGGAQPTPVGALYVHLDAGVASIAMSSQGETYLDPDEADAYAAALTAFAAAARSVSA